VPQMPLKKGEELPQVAFISLESLICVPTFVVKVCEPGSHGLTQVIAKREFEVVFRSCCQWSRARVLMRTSILSQWLSDS
jgi:hypothetical protein